MMYQCHFLIEMYLEHTVITMFTILCTDAMSELILRLARHFRNVVR